MTYRDSSIKSSKASVLFDGVDSISENKSVLPDDHHNISLHHKLSDVTSTEIVSRNLKAYCGSDNEVDSYSKVVQGVENAFHCRHSDNEDDDGEDEENLQSLGSIPSSLISLFRDYLLNNNTIKNNNFDVNDTVIDGANIDRSLSTITEESSDDNTELENDWRSIDLYGDIEIDSVLGESHTDLLSKHITEQFGLNQYGSQSDGSSDELSPHANGQHSAHRFRLNNQFGITPEDFLEGKTNNQSSRVRWLDEDSLFRHRHNELTRNPDRESEPARSIKETSHLFPSLPEDNVHDVIRDTLRKLYVSFGHACDENCDDDNDDDDVNRRPSIDPVIGDHTSPLKSRYTWRALNPVAITQLGCSQSPLQSASSPPDVVNDAVAQSSVVVPGSPPFDDASHRVEVADAAGESAMLAVVGLTDRPMMSHSDVDDADDNDDNDDSFDGRVRDFDVEWNTRCFASIGTVDGETKSSPCERREPTRGADERSRRSGHLPSPSRHRHAPSISRTKTISYNDSAEWLCGDVEDKFSIVENVDDKLTSGDDCPSTTHITSSVAEQQQQQSDRSLLRDDKHLTHPKRNSVVDNNHHHQRHRNLSCNDCPPSAPAASSSGPDSVTSSANVVETSVPAHKRPTDLNIKTDISLMRQNIATPVVAADYARTSGRVYRGGTSGDPRTISTEVSSSFQNLVDNLLWTPTATDDVRQSHHHHHHLDHHQAKLHRSVSQQLGSSFVEATECNLVGRGDSAGVDGLRGLLMELVSVKTSQQPLSSFRPSPTSSVANRSTTRRVKKHKLSCLKRRSSCEENNDSVTSSRSTEGAL